MRGRTCWAAAYRALALAVAVALGGCGYHAAYGGTGRGPAGRLHVALVRVLVPDAVAADEVMSGLREELAKAGALAAGDGWPRVEVEVLRATEESEGIRAVGGAPVARATVVGLSARAWVVTAPGGDPEDDTGDVEDDETASVDEDPRASVFHYADARRAAGRRLGQTLARRLLR